jgi:hypothetical protein
MADPYRTPHPAPRDLLAEAIEIAERVKADRRTLALALREPDRDLLGPDGIDYQGHGLAIALRLVDVVDDLSRELRAVKEIVRELEVSARRGA